MHAAAQEVLAGLALYAPTSSLREDGLQTLVSHCGGVHLDKGELSTVIRQILDARWEIDMGTNQRRLRADDRKLVENVDDRNSRLSAA